MGFVEGPLEEDGETRYDLVENICEPPIQPRAAETSQNSPPKKHSIHLGNGQTLFGEQVSHRKEDRDER